MALQMYAEGVLLSRVRALTCLEFWANGIPILQGGGQHLAIQLIRHQWRGGCICFFVLPVPQCGHLLWAALQ